MECMGCEASGSPGSVYVVKLICFHAYGNKKMQRNLLTVSRGLAFTVSESWWHI